MKGIVLVLLLVVATLQEEFNPNDVRKEVDSWSIGCGSGLRIGHIETEFKLHSHKINYGTGSGQQVVSAINDANDPNSLWLIKEAFGERPCITGKRVACGQRIRLEHLVSGKNLHSDDEFKAPFSYKQEVSLFGSDGRGDINDDWIIECKDDTQDFFKGGTVFALKHAETGKYLYTDNKYTYNKDNCRHCPIIGQREVSATLKMNRYCDWKVVGGILYPIDTSQNGAGLAERVPSEDEERGKFDDIL